MSPAEKPASSGLHGKHPTDNARSFFAAVELFDKGDYQQAAELVDNSFASLSANVSARVVALISELALKGNLSKEDFRLLSRIGNHAVTKVKARLLFVLENVIWENNSADKGEPFFEKDLQGAIGFLLRQIDNLALRILWLANHITNFAKQKGSRRRANVLVIDGILLQGQGRHDTALEKYLSALKSDPANLDAIESLLDIFIETGSPNESERFFLMLKKEDPNKDSTLLERWHTDICFLQGKYAKTIHGFQKDTRADKYDYFPFYRLGLAFLRTGQKEKVLTAFSSMFKTAEPGLIEKRISRIVRR